LRDKRTEKTRNGNAYDNVFSATFQENGFQYKTTAAMRNQSPNVKDQYLSDYRLFSFTFDGLW